LPALRRAHCTRDGCMKKSSVYRLPMADPSDTTELAALIENGTFKADEVVAVLAKTEGNGCVNDFTRGFTTFAYQVYLADRLGVAREEVARRVAFVMSGGTEGVLSPHANIFVNSEHQGIPNSEKRLAVGVGHTRDFLPEEMGRMAMVEEVSGSVCKIMKETGIERPEDVHFAQIKCPLLTSERIAEARKRDQSVVTVDTYESMAYTRAASALGIALALGELAAESLSDEVICEDWNLYSEVASTSSGVEVMNCEIILMGNASSSISDLVIGHSVMKDALDSAAVIDALRAVGLKVTDGRLDPEEAARLVNVYAKAEPDPSGYVRGRRHTMINDSDINKTRHGRSVVGAVVASVVGDPMVYVSGGAEHQGPAGGGPVAAIARAE